MTKVLWTQKQDIGPQPRSGHALAYDAARRRVVLFGGEAFTNGLLRDTWEWDGESWTQVADTGPSPRADCAMLYDAGRQTIMLFGGAGGSAPLGDTWEWDGADWTQVTDIGPSPRGGHAIAFDSYRKRSVLFGGEAQAGALLGDTWEWDGQEWVQREDTGPPFRRSHGMTYDGRRHRIVLFGGAVGVGVTVADTWLWDGARWKEVAHFGPEPRMSVGMVFDGDGVLLQGGKGDLQPPPAQQVLADTWEWDGKHWTQRQDIGPGPRWSHSIAYDSDRQRTVLFGGLSGPGAGGAASLLGDTWETPAANAGAAAVDPEIVIGKATTTFFRDGTAERVVATPLGDLVADAMRESYATQIAIITGGELRSSLPSNYQPINHALSRINPPFDVVAGDVMTILPFGSLVLIRKITGAQLWTILENSVSREPAPFGGFAQISGFRFTYQLSAAPGARVRSVQLNNATNVAANSNTVLTLAISSFAGTGGDGYSMLSDASFVAEETIADVLFAHIKQHGTVTPATSGRIGQLP